MHQDYWKQYRIATGSILSSIILTFLMFFLMKFMVNEETGFSAPDKVQVLMYSLNSVGFAIFATNTILLLIAIKTRFSTINRFLRFAMKFFFFLYKFYVFNILGSRQKLTQKSLKKWQSHIKPSATQSNY